MKTVLIIIIGCFALIAQANEYIVGIPPSLVFEDRTNVLTGILKFVLEESAPGDTIRVIDAWEQMQVTTFKIPEGKLFEGNKQARLVRIKSEIAALIKFVNQGATVSEPSVGTINLPRFLDFVIQIANGGKPTVIIVANPFYVDSANEAFNSRKTYFSDGHIMADPSESVFSTTQKQGSLKAVTVHYGVLRNSFVNSLHEEKTRRFWSLYIGSQHGVLATFLADIGLTFQRARQGITAPCVKASLDLADTAVEMRPVNSPVPALVTEPPKHLPSVVAPPTPIIVTMFTNAPPLPPIVITNTIKETMTNVVYQDRPVPVYVQIPTPTVNIPWEGKGGRMLIRLSEESRK